MLTRIAPPPSTGARPVGDPVLAVQSHLSERDLTLINWLVEHEVLTASQIARALYPRPDMAQDRLLELFRLNVLDRFRPPRPAGGSWPFRYVLGQLGVEVHAALHDQPPPAPARRQSSPPCSYRSRP